VVRRRHWVAYLACLMGRPYVPEAGDIVCLHPSLQAEDSQARHERADHRPALVVSHSSFEMKTTAGSSKNSGAHPPRGTGPRCRAALRRAAPSGRSPANQWRGRPERRAALASSRCYLSLAYAVIEVLAPTWSTAWACFHMPWNRRCRPGPTRDGLQRLVGPVLQRVAVGFSLPKCCTKPPKTPRDRAPA